MSITFSALPYETDALEPMISKVTVEQHYFKHHQNYVETLNRLILGTNYQHLTLEEILDVTSHQGASGQKIFNQAAQVWNHHFYWRSMMPNSQELSKNMKSLIVESFGSVDGFYDQFIRVGVELFGSGYVWLVKAANGNLYIQPGENALTPLTEGQQPLLCCDVWEHAYYLDVRQDRETYLKQFCLLINWKFAEANFSKLSPSTVYNSSKTGEDRSWIVRH